MVNNYKTKKVIFSGGGTGGSVTPLLAAAEELCLAVQNGPDWELVFVGTNQGPEQELVANFNRDIKPIRFIPIISGKLRRYFSLANVVDLVKIITACFVSFYLLLKERPGIIVSAGSFVSVPLVWVGAILKIPIIVHQSDIRPGLANRLSAPFARVVTVAFHKSLVDFARSIHTGNPVRHLEISETAKEEVRKRYGLLPQKPLLLVSGGGTGSSAINYLVSVAAPQLAGYCQIIHITGHGKGVVKGSASSHYQVFDFLPHEDILVLMSLSGLIISRAGLAFLSELSYLGKAAILIPMPKSHQEENAAAFSAENAAIVLSQNNLKPTELVEVVKKTLADKSILDNLGQASFKVMKRGGAQAIAKIIKEIVG